MGFNLRLWSKWGLLLQLPLLQACTTGTSQFEVKERTEVTEMGEAPLVDIFLMLDDTAGAKIVQALPAVRQFVDGFATAIADPQNQHMYCINTGFTSAAYTPLYGSARVDDSKRTLGDAVCNFDENGRSGTAAEISAALREKFQAGSSGPSVTQLLAAMFRVFEFNDPMTKSAPFPRGRLGRVPDVYLMAFAALTSDNSPVETLIPQSSPPRYELHPSVQTPMIQNSIRHYLQDRDATNSLYFDSSESLGLIASSPFTSTCVEDVLNPNCVCGDILEPNSQTSFTNICHRWIYETNYPLMDLPSAQTRAMNYFRSISGSSAPKVVMATMGNQRWDVLLPGWPYVGYLISLNTRMNHYVNGFNSTYSPEADAICAAFQGRSGKCNFDYASEHAIESLFHLAQQLAESSVRPVVLKLIPDVSKPLRVVLMTSAGMRELIPVTDYNVQGNTIVFSNETRNEILQQQVELQPRIQVTYYPIRTAL